MGQARRAVVVTAHGGVDVLQIREGPAPDPGPDQLLVQVVASGVNFVDVYRREGVYPGTPPFVLGGECAGRVVATGADVTGFSVGDVVASASVDAGSHADYTVLDAATTVLVPEGVDARLAAAAMLQGMTAHYLTHSTFPVRPGETVLVHAGAGGVGQLLIQMSKSRGARVIATVGSERKVAIAQRVGADDVLRYDQLSATAELVGAVRELVPEGVHVVYDGVGKATFDASLAALRIRGMLALYGGASGQVPPFDLQRLNAAGSLFVTRPSLGHYIHTRDELLDRAGAVLGSIADGTLQIEIGGQYALADSRQAYRDLEGRASTGKLLIVP
jgi:NADPH2:quinone reductase